MRNVAFRQTVEHILTCVLCEMQSDSSIGKEANSNGMIIRSVLHIIQNIIKMSFTACECWLAYEICQRFSVILL